MPAYSDVVSSLAKNNGQDGLTWEWCTPYKGSVEDCPINNYELHRNNTMVVAVHNPTDSQLEKVEIKVPHGHFVVNAWDSKSEKYSEVLTDVFC